MCGKREKNISTNNKKEIVFYILFYFCFFNRRPYLLNVDYGAWLMLVAKNDNRQKKKRNVSPGRQQLVDAPSITAAAAVLIAIAIRVLIQPAALSLIISSARLCDLTAFFDVVQPRATDQPATFLFNVKF